MGRRTEKTPDGRRIPGYRLHKPSGRAYVRINGKQIYLGQYDDTEGSVSILEYRRMIAEWRASGYVATPKPAPKVVVEAATEVLTVRELTAWFLPWAQKYYSRGEFLLCRGALKDLCKLYGEFSVEAITVIELSAARQGMVDRGLARKSVNSAIRRIQRAFGQAASDGLIPPGASVAVRALKPLRRGRTTAPDFEARMPAEWDDVEATCEYLTPMMRAVVLALWHTGARIGEICLLRSEDVDMTGDVWVFGVAQHKTVLEGHSRSVVIGPQAQAVLRPYVKLDPLRYWFDPAVDSAEQQAAWRDASKEERKEMRIARPGAIQREYLDPKAVGRRVRTACTRAEVKFTLHQLRHAALTRIREAQDLEGARLVAGQHSDVVTRGYTHSVEVRKASAIAKELG